MGAVVLRLQSVHMLHLLSLSISFGRGFGYGHNWTSVTTPLSATAETRKTCFNKSLASIKVITKLPVRDLFNY